MYIFVSRSRERSAEYTKTAPHLCVINYIQFGAGCFETNMKKQFSVLVALFLGMSITSAQTKDSVEYLESSARILEPAQSVMVLPLVAEMQVFSDRISYTEVESYKNYPVRPGIVPNIPNFKKIALSKATHKYGADVLIGATFDVITNDEGYLEITVTGYPAKYVNFHNATEADVKLVALSNAIGDNGDDALVNPQSQTKVTLVK